MTLESFYAAVGGNYADTLRRLYSEALVRKFVLKYQQDGTFAELQAAHAAADWETAFRAAHTLKGIALNLGFERLYTAAAALTEALRGPRALTDEALYDAVAREHAALLEAIAALEG